MKASPARPNAAREQQQQQPPLLLPILAVGVSNVPGAISCLQGEAVAYVCGHCVATCSVDTSYRSVLSEPCETVRSITATATTSDGRWMAAAEFMAGGSEPQITLLDASRRLARCQILRGPDVFKYVYVAFSADAKHLIAIGCDEDQRKSVFHIWDWERSTKPISSGEAPEGAQAVSMHPKFPTNVVTQHPEEMILWRKGSSVYKRHALGGLRKAAGTFYMHHTWLSDGRLVVAASDSSIQVVDAASLHVCAREVTPLPINCLLALPDSVLAVAMGQGDLMLYRCVPSDSKGHAAVQAMSHLKVPDGVAAVSSDRRITQLSLDPHGQKVACLMQQGPVLIVDVHLELSHFLQRSSTKNAPDVGSDALWQQALPSRHTGPITSLTAASKREFLATCSSDLTVRVWQYNPLRLVLTHYCHHEPLAVGMGPWARELVVCYVDSCRCYAIVEGMLLEVAVLMREEPGFPPKDMTKCSLVKFNPTGHLVAIVGGKGCKEISIFSMLHHKQLSILRGHFSSVSDMAWSEDGLRLVSASEGEVYSWHMETFTRLQSGSTKSFLNTSVTCTPDFSTIVVGGGGQGIRILQTSRVQPSFKVQLGKADARAARKQVAIGEPSEAASPWPAPSAQPGSPVAKAKAAMRLAVSLQGLVKRPPPGADFDFSSRAWDTASEAEGGAVGTEGEEAAPPPPAGAPTAPTDMTVKSMFTSLMGPSRACLALLTCEGHWSALVGAQNKGKVRVANLPPASNRNFQEYALHSTDVCCLVPHAGGRLLFSADIAGTWMVHMLMPANAARRASMRERSESARSGSMVEAAAAAALAAAAPATPAVPPPLGYDRPSFQAISAAGHALLSDVLPEAHIDALDVVSVRMVDMRLLKESVRDLKDKLAKASTQAEYKQYQREQEVRRELEAELQQWRKEAESSHAGMMVAREELAYGKHMHEITERQLKESLEEALEEDQQSHNAKLSYEIDHTNLAEKALRVAKAKFGKRLWELEQERVELAQVAAVQEQQTEVRVQAAAAEAERKIRAARVRMDLEMEEDAMMNDEEISSMTAINMSHVQHEQDRVTMLERKYEAQKGVLCKTQMEYEALKDWAAKVEAERDLASGQLAGMSEELEAMRVAWVERDERQRQQDAQIKTLMERLQYGQSLTKVATQQIQELTAEMTPMKEARNDAQAMVARLEDLQVRQAEQKYRASLDFEQLKEKHEKLKADVKEATRKMDEREAHFQNFTVQLFKVLHGLEHTQWAVVLGRMAADYQAGRHVADWSRYVTDHSGSPSGGPPTAQRPAEQQQQQQQAGSVVEDASGSAGADGAGVPPLDAITQVEWKSQLLELQVHVKHLEKSLATSKETKERQESAHRLLVRRLVAENQTLAEEINEFRRALRAEQHQRRLEGHQAAHELAMQQQAQRSGGATTATTLPPTAAPTTSSPPLGHAASLGTAGASTPPIPSSSLPPPHPGSLSSPSLSLHPHRLSLRAGSPEPGIARSLSSAEMLAAAAANSAAASAAPAASHQEDGALVPNAFPSRPGTADYGVGPSRPGTADYVGPSAAAAAFFGPPRPGTSYELGRPGSFSSDPPPTIHRPFTSEGGAAAFFGSGASRRPPPSTSHSNPTSSTSGWAGSRSMAPPPQAWFPSIPENASGTLAAAAGARPDPVFISGTRPEGGWWLADDGMFEVPSVLSTIMQGAGAGGDFPAAAAAAGSRPHTVGGSEGGGGGGGGGGGKAPPPAAAARRKSPGSGNGAGPGPSPFSPPQAFAPHTPARLGSREGLGLGLGLAALPSWATGRPCTSPSVQTSSSEVFAAAVAATAASLHASQQPPAGADTHPPAALHPHPQHHQLSLQAESAAGSTAGAAAPGVVGATDLSGFAGPASPTVGGSSGGGAGQGASPTAARLAMQQALLRAQGASGMVVASPTGAAHALHGGYVVQARSGGTVGGGTAAGGNATTAAVAAALLAERGCPGAAAAAGARVSTVGGGFRSKPATPAGGAGSRGQQQGRPRS